MLRKTHFRLPIFALPLWAGIFVCLWAPAVNAGEPVAPAYVQVTYGHMTVGNTETKVTGGDYGLNLFGISAQIPYAGSIIQYGLEYGALLCLQHDLRSVVISGGGTGGDSGSGISVSMDINAFLLDGYFGGFVSAKPWRRMRMYFGAGPLLIYGERACEPAQPVPEPYATSEKSALGAGAYARAGLDIIFTDRFILGAAIRGTRTNLSFRDAGGKVDMDGWQYFIGVSFYY